MIERTVDLQIAEDAGRVRTQTGMRLPDAPIAATALGRGLTLHTGNHRLGGHPHGAGNAPYG
ncbi:MAG: hypothetical protein ACM3JP_00645 [Betaproteobacteria bacterium]